MELLIFAIAALVTSTVSFWLLGSIYGLLLHRPAIYFPVGLALKRALGAVLGVVALGFGGIVLATFIMNLEFKKRPDYRPGPTLIAGALISTACSAITFVAVFGLAWQILG